MNGSLKVLNEFDTYILDPANTSICLLLTNLSVELFPVLLIENYANFTYINSYGTGVPLYLLVLELQF